MKKYLAFKTVVNAVGLVVVWAAWLLLAIQPVSLAWNIAIAVGGALLLAPLVVLGRRLLDRQPNKEHAERVTLGMHYLIALLLGSAVISALAAGQSSEDWPIPLPPWLGLLVMTLSGLLMVAVVLNLALKGLGSPMAISLTRLVVTDWLYAWVRNPLMISVLAFLVGLGLWIGSWLFIVWALVVVSPVILVMMKVFEERELEIRFGQSYLDYKARTPAFIPRRPRP